MDEVSFDNPGANALSGKLVLLVEDNLIVVMAAGECFTMLGAEIVTASSIETAESAIMTRRPDLAVLDINVGSSTSFDFARRLSAMGVPFIFASGYGDQADRPDDLRGRPIVAKPYRREQLAAAAMLLLAGGDRGQ